MQLGVKCPRGLVDWDDCLSSCAPNPLHPCQYTPDILNQMRVDYTDPDREPGVESFTPTRILGCARQPVIMGDADYYVDVDHQWPLVRGNMVHALMERATYPGAVAVIREQRMSTTVWTGQGPQPFTGKPDLIVVKSIAPDGMHIKVVDYKSTGEIGHDLIAAKADHQLQVNMYAWLASECVPGSLEGIPAHLGMPVVVDEVEIVYASMKKIRRFTSAGPLTTTGKMKTRNPRSYERLDLEPIKLYDMRRVGRFIKAGIEARLDAKEELPDILDGDAAWICEYCPVKELCFQIGNR